MRIILIRAIARLLGLQILGSVPYRATIADIILANNSLFGRIDPQLFLYILQIQAKAIYILTNIPTLVQLKEKSEPLAALSLLATNISIPGSVTANDNDDGKKEEEKEEKEKIILSIRRSKQRRLGK